MRNTQKSRWLTFFTGIVLMLVGNISISHAQVTPVDFRGTWNTVAGKGKKIVITLETVRRTSVTGTYARNGLTAGNKPSDGSVTAFVKVSAPLQSASSISGTVTDNVLRFKWFEDGGHGAGRFTMSSDGQSFQGTFSLTDNPDDTSGGTWNGTRAPVFAGVWQAKAGDKILFPQVLFQQSGSQVVGQLFAGNDQQGVIREGVIDGNTLRFRVLRPQLAIPGRYSPDIPMGVGELVMNPDGKSFKGTVLGASVSGTRLGGR
ncbi:MAG: hypothetical protein ABL999_16015 [Pyrinomonadaceae bacterium]